MGLLNEARLVPFISYFHNCVSGSGTQASGTKCPLEWTEQPPQEIREAFAPSVLWGQVREVSALLMLERQSPTLETQEILLPQSFQSIWKLPSISLCPGVPVHLPNMHTFTLGQRGCQSRNMSCVCEHMSEHCDGVSICQHVSVCMCLHMSVHVYTCLPPSTKCLSLYACVCVTPSRWAPAGPMLVPPSLSHRVQSCLFYVPLLCLFFGCPAPAPPPTVLPGAWVPSLSPGSLGHQTPSLPGS